MSTVQSYNTASCHALLETREGASVRPFYMVLGAVSAAVTAGYGAAADLFTQAQSQPILGPDLVVGVEWVVNLSIVLGAALALVHFGGIFKGWRDSVEGSKTLLASMEHLQSAQAAHDVEMVHLRAAILDLQTEFLRLKEETRQLEAGK